MSPESDGLTRVRALLIFFSFSKQSGNILGIIVRRPRGSRLSFNQNIEAFRRHGGFHDFPIQKSIV